jgi:N-acetylglucosaminyl-diphospho-decaprenol L-rhamnosyltransferase
MTHPDDAVRDALQRVTVLTVTYNSAHCVEALASGLAGVPHVIVVDNASADDSCARVRAAMPSARLIVMPANQGYGVANNAALAAVQTEFALLLNPDCLIDAAQIAALVQAMQDWPQATLAVPQLTEASGQLQVNYSWPRDAWSPKTGEATGVLNVGYACAAVMLVRMARLAPLGFFDPLFFLYYEDEDLCLRVFHARGQILVLPAVRVTHLSRGSVKGTRPWLAEYGRGFHHAQSKVLFAWKHQGPEAAALAAPPGAGGVGAECAGPHPAAVAAAPGPRLGPVPGPAGLEDRSIGPTAARRARPNRIRPCPSLTPPPRRPSRSRCWPRTRPTRSAVACAVRRLPTKSSWWTVAARTTRCPLPVAWARRPSSTPTGRALPCSATACWRTPPATTSSFWTRTKRSPRPCRRRSRPPCDRGRAPSGKSNGASSPMARS